MKGLILAGALALGLAAPAAFADSFHVQGGVGSATNGWSAGSIDGGGSVQNGGHQYTQSQSSGGGYAATNTGLSHGGTYTSTAQQGSGMTSGTGMGGFDYSASNYASGSSNANLAGSYTQHFNYGW
jgi:hypothetical protein